MYCPRCGALNNANAIFCAKCGVNITNPLYQPHPPVVPAYRQLPAQAVYSQPVQYRQKQAQQPRYRQPAQPRYKQSGLHCRKCGSNNVRVEVINQVKLKDKRKGCFWWLFIGWWLPIKWLCFTGWALLFKIFGHKEQEAVNVKRKIRVCQNCGHTW